MRNHANTSTHAVVRQGLIGLAFLGVVAMLSLPAARGIGPLGWMPLWLLGMPLAALAALALADLRERQGRPAVGTSAPALRRRTRPVQARRRSAPRPGRPRRRAAA